MNKKDRLIVVSVFGLLVTGLAYAKSAKKPREPVELVKLRKEYQKKALSEITPVNDRYLVLLKRMEKSFLRNNDIHSAVAVSEEIEQLEKNSAYLLLKTSKKKSVEQFEGEWFVDYDRPAIHRIIMIKKNGHITAKEAFFDGNEKIWPGGNDLDCKLKYDEENEMWISVQGGYTESYELKHGKLEVIRWKLNGYPDMDQISSRGIGKLVD